jgi:hypothetical protein
MLSRYRPWLREFSSTVLAVIVLVALVTISSQAAPPPKEMIATNTPPAPTATPTPEPSPSPTIVSASTPPAQPPPGLGGSLASMIDLRTTGGTVPFEPFAALVSGRPDKPPAVPVLKSTAVAPPRGQAPAQMAEADVNLAAHAAATRATLTVINQSSVEICYVYISSSESDSWGEDWLGDDSIRPGKRRQFRLPEGEYDVKAEDCDGNMLEEHRGVDLSGNVAWTIEDADEQAQGGANETDEAEDNGNENDGAQPEPVALTRYLCCGYTVGGTRIWGISYPDGWQIQYLPNGNPNDFVGAIFSNPDGNMEVVFIPSGWTPMGTPMDTGDVDQYLDAYAAHRAQQDTGFQEFTRDPVPGFPMYRVWSGTWWRDDQQFWESYLVGVNAMPYVEGMSRGTVLFMGPRGETSHWNQAKAIYNEMLATVQVEVIGPGGYTPPPPGPSDSPEEEGIANEGGAAASQWELVFCPRACRWENIDLANQPAGQQWCCSDGCVGQLSEVPCTEDQCNASCAY